MLAASWFLLFSPPLCWNLECDWQHRLKMLPFLPSVLEIFFSISGRMQKILLNLYYSHFSTKTLIFCPSVRPSIRPSRDWFAARLRRQLHARALSRGLHAPVSLASALRSRSAGSSPEEPQPGAPEEEEEEEESEAGEGGRTDGCIGITVADKGVDDGDRPPFEGIISPVKVDRFTSACQSSRASRQERNWLVEKELSSILLLFSGDHFFSQEETRVDVFWRVKVDVP